MKLEKVSLSPPKGLYEFLVDLGDGESGASGTPVPSGAMSLDGYLQKCCDMIDESKVEPGFVPQTIYWLLEPSEDVVGMVKVRDRLSEFTRINGGHVGFYIHSAHRGKGYGKRLLAFALEKLKQTGINEILITVFPDNAPSIAIVEANGGKYCDTVKEPKTGVMINRYWVKQALG
jgi:predicted acetyltransferase